MSHHWHIGAVPVSPVLAELVLAMWRWAVSSRFASEKRLFRLSRRHSYGPPSRFGGINGPLERPSAHWFRSRISRIGSRISHIGADKPYLGLMLVKNDYSR